jgi:hypothetical protein
MGLAPENVNCLKFDLPGLLHAQYSCKILSFNILYMMSVHADKKYHYWILIDLYIYIYMCVCVCNLRVVNKRKLILWSGSTLYGRIQKNDKIVYVYYEIISEPRIVWYASFARETLKVCFKLTRESVSFFRRQSDGLVTKWWLHNKGVLRHTVC